MLYVAASMGCLYLLTSESAAAKGLVAGRFTISREDGTLVDGMNETEV